MFAVVVTISLQYSKRRNADHLQIQDLEREILKTRLEVQEQTLEDISREVHDNIGSLASMAIAHLDSANPAEMRVAYALPLLRDIHMHVRNFSKILSIETIRASGLEAAIEQLVGLIRQIPQYEIVYQVYGDYQFQDVNKEFIAFRILQESVNNILKHSQADKIAITVTHEPAKICLVVEDNGKGIDLNAPPKAGGLANIKYRAALIDAKLKIENPVGGGTKITLCIPLPKK